MRYNSAAGNIAATFKVPTALRRDTYGIVFLFVLMGRSV